MLWTAVFNFAAAVLQFPQYASSANVYHQETVSPAPNTTYSGVTSKVSAWLQQTHDIDATSAGKTAEILFRQEQPERPLTVIFPSSV